MEISVLLKVSDKKTEHFSVFSLDLKDMLVEVERVTNYVDSSNKTTLDQAKEYTDLIKEYLYKEDTKILYRYVLALFYLYNIKYTNIAMNGLYITFESYLCENKYDILKRINDVNNKDFALLN